VAQTGLEVSLRTQAFYEGWTKEEAYLKLRGGVGDVRGVAGA
jgi:phosphopantetheinyl transferase